MIEFSVILDAVDGKEGSGPHFLDVWCVPSMSKSPGPVMVTLYCSPTAWAGELMRVEELAKHVAVHVTAMNNTGNWEVEISYSTEKNRWCAKAKHVSEDGTEGLTRTYTEWAN